MLISKKFTLPFVILLFIALILLFISNKEKSEKETQLALKSYKNTIALYRDNKIIETYDDIVLNTLPEYDKKCFNEGISINSVEEAEKFLNDYE